MYSYCTSILLFFIVIILRTMTAELTDWHVLAKGEIYPEHTHTVWSEPPVSFQCQALPEENKKNHTGLRIEMNFRHSKIRLVP